MNDVTHWLHSLGLAEHAPTFVAQGIDVDLLPQLGDADLRELGVAMLGHRKRLLLAIAALSPGASGAAAAAPSRPVREAERRQLTVMFCDLVGSTLLAGRLDPEDLQRVIRSYHDAVAAAVAPYDGHMAQLLGDGCLVYFGYPRAHEDDAERAVHSALNVLKAVAKLSGALKARGTAPPREGARSARDDPAPTELLVGIELKTRIGIATGLVVIGEIGAGTAAAEQTASGETPNLAARLQGVAEPNAIVVSSGTKDLLGDQFGFQDLGLLNLKGFSEAVRAWRVTVAHDVESRFRAAHADRLSRYVGRERELALLTERWRQAKEGEGQIVLVSGEAGIGKSRITDMFRDLVREEPHVRILYQCSPHHVNSPFYPVVQQFQLAAGIRAGDSSEAKLDKLENLIGDPGAIASDAPLFAELLLLPVGNRHPSLNLTPQEKKQRTLQALLAMFQRLAADNPVLFLLEDGHWIDPTTRELLDLIAERIAGLRALMIVTHRPEFQAHWSAAAHCATISLNRLGRKACDALIADIAKGLRLPEEVHEQIVATTDGIPLFIEELTKMVLESGLLTREDGRYTLAGPLPPFAIPSTLHDSLMARLDRLEGVKEIAQIGAAIGREFPHPLLEAVVRLNGAELESALVRLAASEIIFRRGVPPGATYVFKHALIQDAAYESLLRSSRQQIHARIAAALRSEFAARVENEPEVLAHHYARAGLLKEAAPWWLLAGQRAVARSANLEAIAHLNHGIDTLPGLPEDGARIDLELEMQISLGSAQIAMRGYSAAETEKAYLRGRELIAKTGDDPRQFAILHGLCMVYWNRAQLAQMLEVTEDMLARAVRQGDSLPKLVAHRVTAVALNPMGRFAAACSHAEKAVDLHDPRQHRDSAHQFGHDMAVGAYWHLAIARLFLGQYAASNEAAGLASALARRSQNANTLLYDFLYRSFTGVAKSDWAATRDAATSMIEQAVVRAMALWEAFGRHLLGCVLAVTGEPEAALDELHRGRRGADLLSNTIFKPMTLGFEALALARLRRFDDAIECLDQAIGLVEVTEERWWEPELYRYRGLIERQRNGAVADCESNFRRAIEVARKQDSKIFELRGMIDLADLWVEANRIDEARDILAPHRDMVADDVDTADSRKFKSVLDRIGR